MGPGRGNAQQHSMLPFAGPASMFRRKVSYMRCTPTFRLLGACLLLFGSLCILLMLQAPGTCPPCKVDMKLGAHAELPTGAEGVFIDASKDADKPKEADEKSDKLLAPKAAAELKKIPAVESKADVDSRSEPDIKLLAPKAAAELKKIPAKESPKKTKRRFRNPPVPERPDISDVEQAKHKLAIIIPYRDRMDNLKVFVPAVSEILRQQKISFAIYIVEQTELGAFNRGKLCNIGFQTAKRDGYDYVAIHDVDKVPVSANVSYRWPGETFVHMATCVEQFKYELPYYNFLGGVVMFRMDHFEKFNGMTNVFWGFGAEDDDLWVRIKRLRLKISRARECERGRFVSLSHDNASLHYPNVDYNVNYNLYRQLLKRRRRMEDDGLAQLKYKLLERSAEPLGYVRLTVNVCMGDLGRASMAEAGCEGPDKKKAS